MAISVSPLLMLFDRRRLLAMGVICCWYVARMVETKDCLLRTTRTTEMRWMTVV